MKFNFLARLLVLVVVFAGASRRLVAQDKLLLGKDSCDAITKGRFYRLAADYKARMDQSKLFSDRDAITLIRIYNTSFLTTIVDDSSHARLISGYWQDFETLYKPAFLKKYGLGIGKGGSTYLMKLDIYVGTHAPMRCRDLYMVENR